LFKKIIKNNDDPISKEIDRLKGEYLKRCGTSKHEEGWVINTNEEGLRTSCKSTKKIGHFGKSIYEFINFDNSDKEFKKLLENGWTNDEELNELKKKFNSMLNDYYKFLDEIEMSVNERVIIE